MTLIVNNDALSCAAPSVRCQVGKNSDTPEKPALVPKPCSENRKPPAKKHVPRTSTENLTLVKQSTEVSTTLAYVTQNRTNN